MKEIMCTHLAKRGNTYYYRRKTPLGLTNIFGKEVMISLGTKNRKEAEILVRKMGSLYDERFSQAHAEALGVAKNTEPSLPPKPAQIKPPRLDDSLERKDVHSPLLSELVSKWATERKPRPQSIVKLRRIISRFDKLVGVIKIADISKKDVVAFKDGLLAEGGSPANVNQYLTELNTILNFASHQAIIDSNPASGIRVKVHESAKVKRQPFDLPALTKIFNTAIYTSSARPSGGKGEAAYWLPLLALYTGARLDELCQLNTKDIYMDSYQDEENNKLEVWVLHITDEGLGQKLKNSGSRRRIPLHKELINLGFIKYIHSLDGDRVFPELTPASAYNSLSANWSKWFGRHLRKTALVSDSRMVFHSFRHCFKDYARTASVSSEVHNALTGHSSGDVADNYGSDKYPLRPLAEAMEKYKVTGLVLPPNPHDSYI